MNLAELPDEYGLSSDSLRGSHEHIAHTLVNASGQMDPFTRREVSRGPLSTNELRTLHSAGVFVDENGDQISDPADILVTLPGNPVQGFVPVGGIPTQGVNAPTAPVSYTPEQFVQLMRNSGMTVSFGEGVPTDTPATREPQDVPVAAPFGGEFVAPDVEESRRHVRTRTPESVKPTPPSASASVGDSDDDGEGSDDSLD